MRHFLAMALIAFFCLTMTGCDTLEDDKSVKQPSIYDYQRPGGPREQDDRVPPAPPIKETFDSSPQLSLFPRVGDYQPESDSERHPFWRTFIDHFSKVSGLLQEPESGNKAWSFRGINTIDSVAFFSPIGVEPETTYRISYKIKTELPEEAKTGLGVLEFSKFLWIGEQYSEETTKEYLLGSQIGVEMTGNIDWETKEFMLVTGSKTRMIHLVFYRDGEHSRMPVLIDDIEIRKAVISGQ
jgi:hypothetical protein